MPPGPTQLQQVGAKPSRELQGAPLFHDRFFTGLWTQRNVLRDVAGVVQERWYGGRGDALLDGLNLELSNRLTLLRAPGSSPYSTATFPQAVNSFYSFKQFTTATETISLMVDTPSTVYVLNPTSKNTVLTKGPGAGPAYFLGVSNVLYMGDGVDRKAWTPVGGLRNWGIARTLGTAASSAWAGAAVNTASGGGNAWANPGNAVGPPDGSYAVATVGPADSDYLDVTTFALTPVAGAPIAGIQVNVSKLVDGAIATGTYYMNAQLLLNGVPTGDVKQLQGGRFGFSTPLVFGGPTDLWGTGLSAAQVGANSVNFGVRIWCGWTHSGTHAFSVDGVIVTATQAGPCAVVLVAGGVSPAPATGYKYVAMYGNSGTVFGQANIPSALIKPDGTHSVQISLTSSADPQVNEIWLLRTRDGGSIYENLPTSPYLNVTADVVDSAPDTQLNPFQLADLEGLNTPPPAGAIAPEFHMGRVWVASGNVVYYSVGPDLGLILGNGNEGFPPANFFTFPSAVTRLLSVSSVSFSMLLVFTSSDVYAIYGNGSAAAASTGVAGITAFFAAPLLRRVGLSSYWALDSRASQIYMMTSDGMVISFNPSSQVIFTDPEKATNEIGFPIGSVPQGVSLNGGSLESIHPSRAYVTWHGAGSADQALYVGDGSQGWFRCNPNQQPDGGPVWSTKRNIVGGCQAVQSVETAPGVFQLLIGPNPLGGSVLFRDPSVLTDNGTAYPCYGRLGAWVMAQPGQIATPRFITTDSLAVGTQHTLKVLLSEIDGTFTTLTKTSDDPPHLVPPSTVYSARFAIRQQSSGTQIPAACRFMQVIVDFGNVDTVQNELLSLTVFGPYEGEA